MDSYELIRFKDNGFELDVEVTTSIGELEINISKEDFTLEQIKFPIRYCPWCGRKVRQAYKKSKK